MLNSKLSRISAIAALAIVCAAAASEADAAKNRPDRLRLGGIVFINWTENPIYFQFRLADEEEWTEYVVEADSDYQLVFDLDQDGMVGVPNIRFDSVGGDDLVTYQEYELEFYEVESEDDMTGFRYEFQYDDSGELIELYSVD